MRPSRLLVSELSLPVQRGAVRLWQALVEARSGVQPIQAVDTSCLRFRNGAEVRDFDPAQYFDNAHQDLLDRFAQFAVIAAREAIADARIEITPELSPRTAVVLGASIGGQSSADAGFQELYLRGRNRVHPLTIPKAMMNAGVSHICMDLGITGPSLTTSTACSSANHAIGLAFWTVRSGQVELAITGGSEAPFSFGLLKAWESMRVVAPDTCRPFSKDRSGLILGEGGAMLVLEPLDRALQRGATIYGEIVGFGMSADAHHVTQPAVSGPAQAMRGALSDAHVELSSVGYINAHGTGTISNDPVETRAIREVFGAHADRVLVISTKSLHGHALGAAGAIEAVATVLALRHGMIPPTINFTVRDPECNLNLVVNKPQAAVAAGTPAEIAAAMRDLWFINSWFGGVSTSAALVSCVAERTRRRELSLLDVAAGSGDLPNAVRQRVTRHGIRLDVQLLDRSPTHLNGAPNAVLADALAVPFRDRSVDLVSSSLFLHHLEPAEVVSFINEALRVCRIAVLINDLRRSKLHLTAVYAGLPLFHSRLTWHDAPASVRRAYTVAELHAMLEQTQAARVEICRHYLFRMGSIVWK